MRRRVLGSTGIEVSVVGFGASPLGGVFGAIDEDAGRAAVRRALDLGVNYFDTAPYYGATRSEAALGAALRGVPRDAYVLSTKVGRYGVDAFDFSAARIESSVFESMARLGVEHVDVLLCHDVEFVDRRVVLEEAIPAVIALRDRGVARAVGISGFPLDVLADISGHADIDVVLSYGQYVLYDTAMDRLATALDAAGRGLINASPLGMGLLSGDEAPSWHPAAEPLRAACREAATFAESSGVALSRLAMRFASRAPAATTLVGMHTPEQVQSNHAAFHDEALDLYVDRLRHHMKWV